jgi:hypothetical protein
MLYTFEDFWAWHRATSRLIPNIGNDTLSASDYVDGQVIPEGAVVINPNGHSVRVKRPHATSPTKFDRLTAEATWHRFHGLINAYDYYTKRGIALTIQAHRMASAYTAPVNNGPQGWKDRPHRKDCPSIAAAIRVFLATHPNATMLYPNL